MLPNQKWAKILIAAAYAVLVAGLVYLFFGSILSLLLPFIFAFFLGYIVQSPAESLQKRIRLPRRVIGVIIVLILIFFLGFVIFLLANQLISEVQRLFEKLSANSESIIQGASDLLGELEKKLPFIYEYLDRDVINGTVTEVVKNLITSLSTSLAGLLTAFVGKLPDIGLFFVVFVIASLYFAADFKAINTALITLVPEKLREKLSFAADRMRSTGAGYLKAYSIILLITFAELFVGFLILGVSYSTTLAIVIAVLDMLPVIGTGTVLVPWGLICLLGGKYTLGIGLLILFGVITLVREFIEPRIIGRSIGMHPLLTLAAMYAGYKLFGLVGILLLPLLVNLAKTMIYDKNQT